MKNVEPKKAFQNKITEIKAYFYSELFNEKEAFIPKEKDRNVEKKI